MNSNEKNIVDILLVDDSLEDSELTREAMASTNIPLAMHVMSNGIEALKFLYKEGKYAGAPRPSMILLDLNLPRKSGIEVLAEIKADKNLNEIPVLIFTTSQAESDIQACYSLHANCFIPKPLDFKDLLKIARLIEGFWFGIVKLPRFYG